MSGKGTGIIFFLGMSFFLITTTCYGVMLDGSVDAADAIRSILQQGGSPKWAPPQGQSAKYTYLYYPDASVYFDTEREVYFYFVNGRWEKSRTLPREIREDLKNFVELDMMTDRPYQFHSEVTKLYPSSNQVIDDRDDDRPPWEPARGERARYQYRYYPDSTVYYDVKRNVYFYSLNGRWAKAPTLPESIELRGEDFVDLRMMTGNPYDFHEEIVRAYPGTVKKVTTYRYRYYPESYVYYDIKRNLYYYQSREQWKKAKELPDSIYIDTRDFVMVDLNTDKPYKYHEDIVRKYPGSKKHHNANRHDNRNKNKHNNEDVDIKIKEFKEKMKHKD